MKRTRFTLVELLVVVAIISILAGMLLPALQRARASAYIAACQSNLRQQYLGVAMYYNDFGYLPYPRGVSNVVVSGSDYSYQKTQWMWELVKGQQMSNQVFACPVNPRNDSLDNRTIGGSGFFTPYVGYEETRQADVGTTHYSMNGRTLMETFNGVKEIAGRIERSDMPGRAVLLTEYAWPVFRENSVTTYNSNLQPSNTAAERKRDHKAMTCTMVTLDGHGEALTFPKNPNKLTMETMRANVVTTSSWRCPFWSLSMTMP